MCKKCYTFSIDSNYNSYYIIAIDHTANIWYYVKYLITHRFTFLLGGQCNVSKICKQDS